MVVVTGMPRSGTSVWLQVLVRAGVRVDGAAFPAGWEALAAANPGGFYEGGFRHGAVGDAAPWRGVAVKMFIPGVIRTDRAWLERVLCTVRPWGAQSASLLRLRALEDARLADEGPGAVARAWAERGGLAPEVEWFLQHVALLRDVRRRALPLRFVGLHVLTSNPAVGAPALRWLVPGLAADRVEQALELVRRSAETPDLPDGVFTPAQAVVARDLFRLLTAGGPMTAGLWRDVEATDRDLRRAAGLAPG